MSVADPGEAKIELLSFFQSRQIGPTRLTELAREAAQFLRLQEKQLTFFSKLTTYYASLLCVYLMAHQCPGSRHQAVLFFLYFWGG